jgi:hypothetical protein
MQRDMDQASVAGHNPIRPTWRTQPDKASEPVGNS